MNLKLPQLIALAIGGVLIYAAVKNVSALEVIKAVLSGKPLPTSGWSVTADDGSTFGSDGYHPPVPDSVDEEGNYVPGTDTRDQQPQPAPDDPRGNHDYFAPVITGSSYPKASV